MSTVKSLMSRAGARNALACRELWLLEKHSSVEVPGSVGIADIDENDGPARLVLRN